MAKPRESDQGRTRAGRKLYSTREWQRLSKSLREKHPYCVECLRTSAQATLQVDHIVPLRDGGAPLDPLNLQVLCASCHSLKTAAERDARAP